MTLRKVLLYLTLQTDHNITCMRISQARMVAIIQRSRTVKRFKGAEDATLFSTF